MVKATTNPDGLASNKAVNPDVGFVEGVGNAIKRDAAVVSDGLSDISAGGGNISKKIDNMSSSYHATTGGSFFKTMVKTAAYGGGLLAAADFLNPFSLGWND